MWRWDMDCLDARVELGSINPSLMFGDHELGGP